MPATKALSITQVREIQRLVEQGFRSPAQIYRHLVETGVIDLDGESRVSAKTVQRRVKELLAQDQSGPWSVLDDDPENARRIAPVWQWLYDATEGRVWLSRNLASLVGRVCAFAALPPNWAWAFARAYQLAQERDESDVRCLDLAVMNRVWENAAPTEASILFSPWFQRLGETCQTMSGRVGGRQWNDLMFGQQVMEDEHSGLIFDLPGYAYDEEEPETEAALTT